MSPSFLVLGITLRIIEIMTRVTTSPRDVTAIVTMEIKSEAGWILDMYKLIA
jgi:hypothetical protein